MARTSNLFINPKTGTQYAWPMNHTTEEAIAKSRQMGDGAPTSNIGLIPQQGAATPMILTWHGRILTRAQHDAMLQWWELCEGQSIYVQKFDGQRFEIIITDFQPQTIAVAQNRADLARAPRNVWDYTLTMRVLRALTGSWHGIAP